MFSWGNPGGSAAGEETFRRGLPPACAQDIGALAAAAAGLLAAHGLRKLPAC